MDDSTGFAIFIWGVIALILLTLFALVKCAWLLLHPRTHMPIFGIMLIIGLFIPGIDGFVIFLLFFAINPWNVNRKLEEVLSSLTPLDITRLVDEQLIGGSNGESPDRTWFDKHWVPNALPERASYVQQHWDAVRRELSTRCLLTPFRRRALGDWAECVRSAHYRETGVLT